MTHRAHLSEAGRKILNRHRELKRRAKEHGYAMTLTRTQMAELLKATHCAMCGKLFGSTQKSAATFERVNPLSGYTLDNVIIACKACNNRKSGHDAHTHKIARKRAALLKRVPALATQGTA